MKFTDIKIGDLKGIGPKKEALYNKLGIYTAEDLIRNYPRAYQDMREPKKISDLKDGEETLIKGKIVLFTEPPTRTRKKMTRILVDDGTKNIEIIFFNQPYLKKTVHVRRKYYFYGKVSIKDGRTQMVQPEIINAQDFRKEILPLYTTIKGISQKEIRKHIRELLDDDIEDFLPLDLVKNRNICPIDYELRNLHFPLDREHLKVARYRQIYEELFIMQLGLQMMRTEQNSGIVMNGDCNLFIDSFEFELTEPQKRSVNEILDDMASGQCMNRLLQGDVGSGKTAVASIAMYKAAINGYQAAFMAPTEILAKQHYESLKNHFEKFDIKVGLLTGSMKTSEKKKALEAILDGEYQIVIGTHALIQERVEFNNLGLVITDEQHRFGVNQRFVLSNKGIKPHVLVMTATPIPRTLAVILYGDLEMSVIDKLPQGRKEIKTVAVGPKQRSDMYENILSEVKNGSQVYVVAPLIEDSENLENVKSVASLKDELEKLYMPYGVSVAVVHGAMKQNEKDEIMARFYSGEIDILVATVVIEVGINVPNATVMVIENTERFGLAQLHQLRGRVGRGEKQSYCYLVNNSKGDVAKKRLKIMCESTDGFYISEEDLKLRGPGEVFGTRQHGIPDISLINAVKHYDILEKAREDAILYKDLKNDYLDYKICNMYGENLNMQL